MPSGQDHPEHLLWYVMGDLPREQMRATRAHLLVCATCRDECKALVSMLEALRIEREASAERDAATARGKNGERPGAPDPPAPPALLHLLPPPPPPRAGLLTHGRVAGSLFVALLVLALPAVWALWRPSSQVTRSIEPVRHVTLMPPVRGASHGPVLEGTGPWLVRVVLPFGAPEGPYSLRLGTGRGTPGEFGETVTQNQEGTLELIVQPLDAGRYQLTVDIDTRPPHDTFIYPFEVRSPVFWRTPPDGVPPPGR
jgi:hypothetical protein